MIHSSVIQILNMQDITVSSFLALLIIMATCHPRFVSDDHNTNLVIGKVMYYLSDKIYEYIDMFKQQQLLFRLITFASKCT